MKGPDEQEAKPNLKYYARRENREKWRRKTKASVELNVVEMKAKQKGSYQSIGSNRKATENVFPLLNVTEDLVTKNVGKKLSAFFAHVFNGRICLQKSQRESLE